MPLQIDQLTLPPSETELHSLALLLVDAVDAGAAVSFLAPLSVDDATKWWRDFVAGAHKGTVILVARDDAGIVGTVQLQPAWAPNQPHRAEVVKLLVHRRAHRRGVGRALMKEIESAAADDGFTLLTLDARAGAVAESLYTSLGWKRVGVIPRYALDPDGTPHEAVFFFRDLNAPQNE